MRRQAVAAGNGGEAVQGLADAGWGQDRGRHEARIWLGSSPPRPPAPLRVLLHCCGLGSDTRGGEEEESVASWGLTKDCGYDYFSDHTAEEDGVCSSDSSLFGRARDLYGNGVEDEVTSQFSQRGGGLARGQSKEKLWVEVRGRGRGRVCR
ncbi:hypothetical protein ZWY2020_037997 [Hordeum vulgare]|nr:hypothetical protein ZWY2020_037997 [Hordeum vulgare]